MKRRPMPRELLAQHEAGHVITIASLPFELGDFTWHRVDGYEICHVDAEPAERYAWEVPHERNLLIANRAAIALGGGAAEAAMQGSVSVTDIRSIHELVGATDFEVAHEWMTLQRYDPSQESIEREIGRLFAEVLELVREPRRSAALAVCRNHILQLLSNADSSEAMTVRVPARHLISGCAIHAASTFELRHTLREAARA